MIQFSNYRQHLQVQTQGASASQGVPEGRLGCDAGDGNKWNCKSQKMNLQRWRIYFTRNLPNLGNIKIFSPIWTLLYKSKVFLLPQHNSASEWTRNIMDDVLFLLLFSGPDGWLVMFCRHSLIMPPKTSSPTVGTKQANIFWWHFPDIDICEAKHLTNIFWQIYTDHIGHLWR